MPPPLVLIGAPTDIGAGARGASMGPEALRVAGLQAALAARGLTVIDRGNLAGPANPWLPPVDGYRHLAEVTAMFGDREWRRDHRGDGSYPEDTLWTAAAGFIELDDWLNRPGR